MRTQRLPFLICLLIAVFALNESASGNIVFSFTLATDGGVDVVGVGSGTVANTVTGSVTSSDWDVQDFNTDFLVDTFTASQTGADTFSGTFTNVTTAQTASLLNFDVDRDATTNDDLDYDTSIALTFNDGDTFSYAMTAHFNPGTLMFSDLILGSHIDVGRTQGSGIAEEVFGITRVNVTVPEPGTVPFLVLMVCGFASRRRKTRCQ